MPIGVLEDGEEEFETSDDLYEVIGVMLQQADDNISEEDMRELCDRLHGMLHSSNGLVCILGYKIILIKNYLDKFSFSMVKT